MANLVGKEARISNPRLAAFQPLIGTWTTVGHHTMIKGVTLHGRTSFDWHEGGGFVCMRTEIDEPKIPSAIALIGSDDHSDAFTMLYFDERGVSRKFDVSIGGKVVQWWRIVPGFSQRYVLTIEDEGTLHGVSSLSQDDKTWEHDMELRYTRVKSQGATQQ